MLLYFVITFHPAGGRVFLLRVVLFLLIYASLSGPVLAAGEKRVLVLESGWHDWHWAGEFARGVHWVFDATPGVDVVQNRIDLPHATTPSYEAMLGDLLVARYRDDMPDVVIAGDDRVSKYLDTYGADIFPHTPKVYCYVLPGGGRVQGVLAGGVVSTPDVAGTLLLMRQMQPRLSHVLVVNDRSSGTEVIADEVRRAAATALPGVTLAFIDQWTVAELAARLRSLSPGSAVLFTSLEQDAVGVRIGSRDLQMLTAASSVPVYSLWDWHVRLGAVGGVVSDGMGVGGRIARIAQRWLNGLEPHLGVESTSINITLVDALTMARFGLATGGLPVGASVVNKPPDMREAAPGLFYGGLVVLLVLSLVVAGLGLNTLQRRKVMRRLSAAESRYRSLFENALEGIFRFSPTQGILAANPAFASMLGYGGVEGLLADAGGSMHSLFESDEEYATLLSRLETDEVLRGVECRLRRRDGTSIVAALSLRADRGADGDITLVEGRAVDVTAEKQARADLEVQRERLRLALDASRDGIWDWDTVNDTVHFSSRYFTMLGYAPDAFANELAVWLDLLHPEDRDEAVERARRFVEGVADGDAYETTFRLRAADGAYRWVLSRSMAAARDMNRRAIRVVGVHTDVTELREAQEQLASFNRELEERVKQRTRELREANQALEFSLDAVRRMQDELVQSEKMASLGGLVAGVAHEINTPVGIGVTAGSWLAEKTEELSRQLAANTMRKSDLERYIETARESSATILSNLKRAADLVQSFKQVAVDQTAAEAREFNLRQFLDEALMSLRPRYKRTSHTVTVDVPEDITLYSYPGDLMQVVTNFMTNSLLHGFEDMENGHMRFVASYEGDKVVLEYSDDGKGMDADHVERVFEPFFTTKRGHGGTGLGMHIVYNIVTQRLKGTIVCRSAPGEGAAFRLVFPRDVRKGGGSGER